MDPFTELTERTLWFDGDNTIKPDNLLSFLANNDVLAERVFVTELNEEINKYNKIVTAGERITVKRGMKPLSFDWNVPEYYITLNIDDYVYDKFVDHCKNKSTSTVSARWNRIKYELKQFEENQLLDVLRVIIYVIATFEKNNVVWGVGRGSSVASYLLHICGVHDIDSFEYDLDFHEFLRKEV